MHAHNWCYDKILCFTGEKTHIQKKPHLKKTTFKNPRSNLNSSKIVQVAKSHKNTTYKIKYLKYFNYTEQCCHTLKSTSDQCWIKRKNIVFTLNVNLVNKNLSNNFFHSIYSQNSTPHKINSTWSPFHLQLKLNWLKIT